MQSYIVLTSTEPRNSASEELFDGACMNCHSRGESKFCQLASNYAGTKFAFRSAKAAAVQATQAANAAAMSNDCQVVLPLYQPAVTSLQPSSFWSQL